MADSQYSLEQSVFALARALKGGRSGILALHDLTNIGYEILWILLSEKECMIGYLSRTLRKNASQMSREVNHLTNRGLLARRRPVDDRRVVLVSLTENGERLGFEIQRLAAEQEEYLAEGIEAEDLDTFRQVTGKMLNDLERRSHNLDSSRSSK